MFRISLCSAQERSCLTFRHWSGITPYTSSYEFAGSCVFGKQSSEKLSLRPRAEHGKIRNPNIEIRKNGLKIKKLGNNKRNSFRILVFVFWILSNFVLRASNFLVLRTRQALSLSYGRFFAEFLEDLSLVRLTLLELITCVGFGTVWTCLCSDARSESRFLHRDLEVFFKSALLWICFGRGLYIFIMLGLMHHGFTCGTPSHMIPKSNNGLKVQHSVPPSQQAQVTEY